MRRFDKKDLVTRAQELFGQKFEKFPEIDFEKEGDGCFTRVRRKAILVGRMSDEVPYGQLISDYDIRAVWWSDVCIKLYVMPHGLFFHEFCDTAYFAEGTEAPPEVYIRFAKAAVVAFEIAAQRS